MNLLSQIPWPVDPEDIRGNVSRMMKSIFYAVAAFLILQSCAGSSSSSNAPANPPANPPPSENPAPQNPPPTTQPESDDFFVGVDKEIAADAKGDSLVAERFNVLMARLSVYALICDAKNDKGYSAQFSAAYNRSTELQALSIKVYGSEKAAYNRLEKQRNIESRRLSFESSPNVCALSVGSFTDYVGLSAADLSAAIKTTPRGSF